MFSKTKSDDPLSLLDDNSCNELDQLIVAHLERIKPHTLNITLQAEPEILAQFNEINKKINDIKSTPDEIKKIGDKINTDVQNIQNILGNINDGKDKVSDLSEKIGNLGKSIEAYADNLPTYQKSLENITDSLNTRQQAITDSLNTRQDEIKNARNILQDTKNELDMLINGKGEGRSKTAGLTASVGSIIQIQEKLSKINVDDIQTKIDALKGLDEKVSGIMTSLGTIDTKLDQVMQQVKLSSNPSAPEQGADSANSSNGTAPPILDQRVGHKQPSKSPETQNGEDSSNHKQAGTFSQFFNQLKRVVSGNKDMALGVLILMVTFIVLMVIWLGPEGEKIPPQTTDASAPAVTTSASNRETLPEVVAYDFGSVSPDSKLHTLLMLLAVYGDNQKPPSGAVGPVAGLATLTENIDQQFFNSTDFLGYAQKICNSDSKLYCGGDLKPLKEKCASVHRSSEKIDTCNKQLTELKNQFALDYAKAYKQHISKPTGANDTPAWQD